MGTWPLICPRRRWRRRSTLPLGITHAQARAILAGCDRRSAIGRRDYAIIVVLLRLGLRRSEVASRHSDLSCPPQRHGRHQRGERADGVPRLRV
jgi:integrase/recombinase XerD